MYVKLAHHVRLDTNAATVGSSVAAAEAVEKLLNMYAMRWIDVPQHPAARASGSFGHSASAAAARQGRAGACESSLASSMLPDSPRKGYRVAI